MATQIPARTRVVAGAALLTTTALALAACAEGGGSAGGDDGGAGVDYGATIEEYQAAFEDIDPITLATQTPAPDGSQVTADYQAYLDAITEWSGGKITFEVAFSNAIVAPAETDVALQDGRLDFVNALLLYKPDDYPANAALVEAQLLSDTSPVVGTLHSQTWANAVAFETPEFLSELEEAGIQPIIPSHNGGNNMLFCKEERTSLADFSGTTISAGTSSTVARVEGLGGSAVSVPFTDLFESLERGVVDCAVSSLVVGVLGGFIPQADHGVIDSVANFGYGPNTLAFNKDVWDDLPLVARQLFWDRIDVYLESSVAVKLLPLAADGITQISESGGELSTLDDDASAAVQDVNESLLAALRDSDAGFDGERLVDDSLASSEEWLAEIGALGYVDEVGWNEFGEWYPTADIDFGPWVEKVYEEIFLPHRPS